MATIKLTHAEQSAYRRFLAALRKSRGKRWVVTADDLIRKRATKAQSKNGVSRFCPITTVCFHRTGESFDQGNFIGAGNKLGLSHRLADQIVDAADNTLYEMYEYEEGPDHLLQIRRDLLRATRKTRALAREEKALRKEMQRAAV